MDHAVAPKFKRFEPLRLPTRMTCCHPMPQIVALPGYSQTILTVQQGSPIFHLDSFQVGIHDTHTANGANQIKGPKHRMVRRENFECPVWKQTCHLLAYTGIKISPLVATRIVNQQQAAKEQIAP